jgi:hypothetical protein
MTVFWDVSLCSLISLDRLFRDLYWPLQIDLGQFMWEYKVQQTPLNSLQVTSKNVRLNRYNNNNLETIPGQHSIDSLQKTAILGT